MAESAYMSLVVAYYNDEKSATGTLEDLEPVCQAGPSFVYTAWSLS